MAKSRSRKTKSKSPRKFLLKKGSRCPTGYLHVKQVKKSSKKYGTKLPSFCVEFPQAKKMKKELKKMSKGSRKGSRK